MIRLLSRDSDGNLVLTEHHEDYVPEYAILSHTWDADPKKEVVFHDVEAGTAEEKAAFHKIQFCEKQAASEGLRHFWVDTCCIDKKNAVELQEAINSMFCWYKEARCCYVYLADVTTSPGDNGNLSDDDAQQLRRSRWFTRGWTLQELIAPKRVEFYSASGSRLGTRRSLERIICDCITVPRDALRGYPLSDFSYDERMAWMSNRKTSRKEDIVYALLGICGVYMPLIYGEGEENARMRLKDAISHSKRPGPPSDVSTPPEKKRRKLNRSADDMHEGHPVPTKQELVNYLRFDRMDDRRDNIKSHYTNTCSWLIDHGSYLEWRNAEKCYEHFGFFWIKGKPGSGKSTLTRFILDQLELEQDSKDATILSFFFHARGTDLEKSTIGLYRSILVQIIQSLGSMESLRRVPLFDQWPWDDKLKTDAERIKRLLRQVLAAMPRKNIVLVVDALDECPQQEIRDMIAFFEQLGHDAVANDWEFRVLFASRPYPHITAERALHLNLHEQGGHARDIQRFISAKLRIGSSRRADRVREEVAERSSGVFMWVALVVDILNTAYDELGVDGLENKLHEVPNDLHALFHDLLTRDARNSDKVLLCLQWVLFAFRPLEPIELYTAVCFGLDPSRGTIACSANPETLSKFVLSSSIGLVEITQSRYEETVQFIHESVRDFLLKEQGLGSIWQHSPLETIGRSHDRLKQCCYDYIQSNARMSLASSADISGSRSPEGTTSDEWDELYGFLRYAIDYVMKHSESAQEHGIDQQDFLEHFDRSAYFRGAEIVTEYFDPDEHIPDPTLEYLLVRFDCPRLLTLAMHSNISMDIGSGPDGHLILTASRHGSLEALQVLVMQDQLQHGEGAKLCPAPENQLAYLAELPEALLLSVLAAYDDIHSYVDTGGHTLLPRLAGQGYDRAVSFLLDKGVDVHILDSFHGTALQGAAYRGADYIVQLLLDRGADVNAQGGGYGNALQAAAFRGRENIVRLLLERGADVNAQGGDYGNALQAAAHNGHENIVRLLLERGADVNAQGGAFGNALQAAAHNGHENIVRLLLERGADVNAQGGAFGNALQAAAADRSENMIRLLLDRGADVNAQGGDYGNALQAAAAWGGTKVTQLLLNNGAVYDVHGSGYRNALRVAVEFERNNAIGVLLRAFGSKDAPRQLLEEMLSLAKKWGRGDSIKVLESFLKAA